MVQLDASLLLSLPPAAAHRQRALQTPDQIIAMRRRVHGSGSLVPGEVGTPQSPDASAPDSTAVPTTTWRPGRVRSLQGFRPLGPFMGLNPAEMSPNQPVSGERPETGIPRICRGYGPNQPR